MLFAVTFLAATLFRSEYTVLAASFVFMIFYPVATLFPPLNRYLLNIHHIMSGFAMPYFDACHALLVGAAAMGVTGFDDGDGRRVDRPGGSSRQAPGLFMMLVHLRRNS